MKITIKNLQKKILIDQQTIYTIIRDILRVERKASAGEINISFITDSAIRKLNARYHARNRPTDVLAFDLGDDTQKIIADIYISADTALANAARFDTAPRYELCLYVVHGMLHILGYDDHTTREKAIMRRKEKKYLSLMTNVKAQMSNDQTTVLKFDI